MCRSRSRSGMSWEEVISSFRLPLHTYRNPEKRNQSSREQRDVRNDAGWTTNQIIFGYLPHPQIQHAHCSPLSYAVLLSFCLTTLSMVDRNYEKWVKDIIGAIRLDHFNPEPQWSQLLCWFREELGKLSSGGSWISAARQLWCCDKAEALLWKAMNEEGERGE